MEGLQFTSQLQNQNVMYCYNNSLHEKIRGIYLYMYCEANTDTFTYPYFQCLSMYSSGRIESFPPVLYYSLLELELSETYTFTSPM